MKTTTTRKPRAKAPAKKAAQEKKWTAWFYAKPEDKKALAESGGCGPLDIDCIVLRRGPASVPNHWKMTPLFLSAAPGTYDGYAEEEGIAAVEPGVVLIERNGRANIIVR